MHKNNVFSKQVLVEGDALVRQCMSEETLSNIIALSKSVKRISKVNIGYLKVLEDKKRIFILNAFFHRDLLLNVNHLNANCFKETSPSN